MIELRDHPDLHTFSCEAMYTTFTFHLECPDADRAADAAGACITRLEQIEADLSRFRHDSDVSRINQLSTGDTLLISENTYACLMQAFEACALTGGLFDVTLGSATWPEDYAPESATGDITGQLELAPDRPLVTCHEGGRQVDLGGIGKGVALDQLAGTLVSYKIDYALLCAGNSTLLAIGPHPWPIALTGDAATKEIELRNHALSASGTGIQGAHIIHPDFPGKEPPYSFRRTWLTAPTAAVADACSTACLLMGGDEIDAFADAHRGDMTIHVEEIDGGRIRAI